MSFISLIDQPLANPDTIQTAIEKGRTLIKGTGEDVLIFTAEQQLYKVIINIMFHKLFHFQMLVPMLGGMHMLVTYVHAISVLMAGSVLKKVLARIDVLKH